MTRILFFLAITMILYSCQPTVQEQRQRGIITEVCLGATDEASFAEVKKIENQKGCLGIRELVLADKVIPLEPGDTVEVVASYADRIKIKSGKYILWIEPAYLEKKG